MNIDPETYKNEVAERLTETFVRSEGFYLDRGASLFETLSVVSAKEASTSNPGNGETVASHVHHLTFYLDVLREYVTGERTGKTDWSKSWTVTTVTENEWNTLMVKTRKAYDSVLELVRSFDSDNSEDLVGETLSILAHSAFHLAAIRQILDAIRR